MLGKFFKSKDSRPPIIKRIIPPHVTFSVICDTSKTTGYSGFDLKNPLASSIGYAVCPCCKKPYNIRIKNIDDIGKSIKAGTRHVFTIISINRKDKERDF